MWAVIAQLAYIPWAVSSSMPSNSAEPVTWPLEQKWHIASASWSVEPAPGSRQTQVLPIYYISVKRLHGCKDTLWLYKQRALFGLTWAVA